MRPARTWCARATIRSTARGRSSERYKRRLRRHSGGSFSKAKCETARQCSSTMTRQAASWLSKRRQRSRGTKAPTGKPPRPQAKPTGDAARGSSALIIHRSPVASRPKGRIDMSFGDFIWLFFIFTSLQPIITQKMLEASRLRSLRRLGELRRSRVIALVHRQETMSLLGFPIVRYINIEDSEEILRAIKLTDKTVPINLILHTPGGLVLAARQIAHALQNHQGKITVYVPHYAMSGGTLLALAADQIVMDPNAVLGPVDPQLNEFPAESILKAVAQK